MKYLSNIKALIIYGPTATGKTALAISLAKKFDGEIISADSRQVYKGLDIGTGKVSFDKQVIKGKGYWIVNGIKIHGFDLVEPPSLREPDLQKPSKPGSENLTRFSVADFLKFAHTTMIRIIVVKKLPIIVGGTGFYIKALIDGIGSIGIPQDPKLRRRLEGLTVDQLYQKLEKLDPKRTQAMNGSDRKNPRRLIRAIEIALYSTSKESKPTDSAELTAEASEVSRLNENLKFKIENYLLVGLTAPNSYLYERADKWLSRRLTKGMSDEVQNLINQNVNHQWLDNLGLEYRWITRYLLGKIGEKEAIERLKGDIHNFIRRQKTWFNKFSDIQLFDISKTDWKLHLRGVVKRHIRRVSHV